MYRVIIKKEKEFDEMEFLFHDMEMASIFIDTILCHSTCQLSATIKKEDK